MFFAVNEDSQHSLRLNYPPHLILSFLTVNSPIQWLGVDSSTQHTNLLGVRCGHCHNMQAFQRAVSSFLRKCSLITEEKHFYLFMLGGCCGDVERGLFPKLPALTFL